MLACDCPVEGLEIAKMVCETFSDEIHDGSCHAVDGGLEGLSDRAFSPDSSLVALATTNGQFRVHSLEDGPPRRVFTTPSEEGRRVAFSEDGTLLALAETSGLVKVIEVGPLMADGSVRTISEFVAQNGDITAMVFSPGGDLLGTSGQDWIRSVNLVDLNPESMLLDDPIEAFFYLPDAGKLVVQHNDPYGHITVADAEDPSRTTSYVEWGFLLDNYSEVADVLD